MVKGFLFSIQHKPCVLNLTEFVFVSFFSSFSVKIHVYVVTQCHVSPLGDGLVSGNTNSCK